MYLRAPRAGVIGYRNAETGAIVSAGTKVFSLVDTSHINVDCTIAEADAAILKAGLPVEVTIDALGEDYAGEIVYVSPAMDEASKTYQVRIELTDEAARETIKAGLFAHTAVDILQRRATLCVPKEALLAHGPPGALCRARGRHGGGARGQGRPDERCGGRDSRWP